MPWHKHLNASLTKWERWFSTDDRLWFLQSWCEDLNLFVSHFWSEENKLGWEIKRVNFHRHCFSSTLQWDLERTTAASQLPGCRVKKRTLKENLRQEELPHRQKPHRNDGIKWKERQKGGGGDEQRVENTGDGGAAANAFSRTWLLDVSVIRS